MALAQLGNSEVYVDLTLVSAKTPVVKNNRTTSEDGEKWGFNVLVDGKWFPLYYDTQGAADTAWATFS